MGERGKRFLEFVNWKTGEVGQRCDVTGDSEHNVERCLRGMLINMHSDWFVRDTAKSRFTARLTRPRHTGEQP